MRPTLQTGIKLPLVALLTAVAWMPASAADGWVWQAKSFYVSDSGDGDDGVDFYGLTLGVGFGTKRWHVQLDVPAVAIDGPGTITGLGAGVTSYIDRGQYGPRIESNGGPTVLAGESAGDGGNGSGSGSGSGEGSGPGSGSSGSFPQSNTPGIFDDGQRSGMGDVRISFRRRMGSNRPWGRLSVLGGVKLPTADENEGLGTGQTDGWLGLDWYRQGWTVDLSAFVEWVELGRTDAYRLESGPAGGFYLDWPVGRLGLEAGLEAAASPIPGAETRGWAILALKAGAKKLAWRVETYYGLNETATDVGVSLTLTAR